MKMFHSNQDSLFKDINESDILKEISNLNSKKVGTLGNIPTKVLKESSNACNTVLRDIWNFEILRKQNFPQNLKLADITSVYKKKDPTLAENYRPVVYFLLFLKYLKGLSKNNFLVLLTIFYLHTYVAIEKVLTHNTLFFHLLRNGIKLLTTKVIQEQC